MHHESELEESDIDKFPENMLMKSAQDEYDRFDAAEGIKKIKE